MSGRMGTSAAVTLPFTSLKILGALFFTVLLFLVPALAGAAPEINDVEISLAVDRQLGYDQNIPAHLIAVSTTDGVVTLTGAVENYLAKERSGKIAATVKGVRSVINMITVLPVPRPSDDAIKQDIANILRADPAIDAEEIKVQVENGVVTLSGIVDSYQEGELSGNLVKSVDGVVELHNNLTFDPLEVRPDEKIEAEIVQRFYWDVWINQDGFTVEVENGSVSVAGTARSVFEMNRARELAWVGGVKSVDTGEVSVDWSKSTSMMRDRKVMQTDSEIRQAVEAAFAYDPRLTASDIKMTVEKGVVSLTGTVASILEKNAAENDARNTVGVWRVKNMIKVQPPDRVPDGEVMKSVEAALAKSRYVTKSQVDVSVVLGRVYLNGTVESFFEKDKAYELAARQKGVVDVRNNLTVYTPQPESEDWEILQDIRTELWWSPFVDEKKVKVSVKEGVAYLSGEVATINEKAAAEENAFEGGAKSVINNLSVKDIPYFATDE